MKASFSEPLLNLWVLDEPVSATNRSCSYRSLARE